MKPDIPATIPASSVSAKAGLAARSAQIVTPAGTDLYNELVNDAPMVNKSGIAPMSATDHLPNNVFGVTLRSCFVILSSFPNRKPYMHLILLGCTLCWAAFTLNAHPILSLCLALIAGYIVRHHLLRSLCELTRYQRL